VALVAPHYFVGSFDDDAGYILTARALLAGHGLTAHLANGTTVAGSYPPGYSALLAPMIWIWPHTFVPLRMFSTLCYALLFPLTWLYLGRRRVSEGVRVAALVVLALGPPLATFGSMVMAETPYLLLLVALLLWVDRWERQPRVWTGAGVGVILATGGLVWLKEAGVGVAAGVVLWLLLTRPVRWAAKAAAVAGGVTALLVPVMTARLVAGVPLAGSRYSEELGGFYQGGLVDRLIHVAPHALWQLTSTALPTTLVPYLTPLPVRGHAPDLWKVLSWQVTICCVAGAVVWARRHRDAALVIVPVYLAETLLWPYVNERRVILTVPVLAAWYVLGAVALWQVLTARTRALRRRSFERPPSRPWVPPVVGGVFAALVVAVPLIVQMPRDYLLSYGQDTSRFPGSRYVGLLAHVGTPAEVVETDYQSSTALFTGHDTATLAFEDTMTSCDAATWRAALASDHAGYLLVGDVNKPDLLDRPCLYQAAASGPWAVQLLHTNRDDASVFELIGPGTGHPGLRDLTALARPSRSTGPGGVSIIEWDWATPAAVSQVSVGEAGSTLSTSHVALQVRDAGGTWRTLAAAPSGVGDAVRSAPYLLASPGGAKATAVRLLISGTGRPEAADVHALGPVPAVVPAPDGSAGSHPESGS
jgi:hypothetical protein